MLNETWRNSYHTYFHEAQTEILHYCLALCVHIKSLFPYTIKIFVNFTNWNKSMVKLWYIWNEYFLVLHDVCNLSKGGKTSLVLLIYIPKAGLKLNI